MNEVVNDKHMLDLLSLAINTLMKVDTEDLETVEVNQTKYDDGSVGYSVNLTFPAKSEQGKTND